MSHHGLSIPNECLEASEVWTPHHPRSSTRAPFPGPALRRESPRAMITRFSIEWRLLGMCNDDGIRIHHRCRLSKTSLQPYPPPMEDIRANQVRAWAQSISLSGWTLLQKLKLRNKVITKTEITRQRSRRSIRCLHPLPLLPSGEEEERCYNLSEQEKQKAKEFLRRWTSH